MVSYQPQSFPTVDVDETAVDESNPASDLAILLARYGFENSGLFAQALHDLTVDRSVLALTDIIAAIGNGEAKSMAYRTKWGLLEDYDPTEAVDGVLSCEGLNEWARAVTDLDNPALQQVTGSSPPTLDEVIEFPASLAEWASKVDTQNQGVYQSLKQGAIVDAISEVLFQQTGRNINALGGEYETLRFAVARATHSVPRGHDQQAPITIRDVVPLQSLSNSTPAIQQSVNNQPVLRSLSLSNPYPEGQTQLKTGDLLVINGVANQTIESIDSLEQGAFSAQSFSINESRFSIQFQIKAEGIVSPTPLPGKLRLNLVDGTSQVYSLADFGIEDLVVNDGSPTISNIIINYPNNQSAVKPGQSLTVQILGKEYDKIDLETEAFQVEANGETFTLTPNPQVATADSTEYFVKAILTKTSNGKKESQRFSVAVERDPATLVNTANTNLKSSYIGVTQPIKLTFDRAVRSVSLVDFLPVGTSKQIKGFDRDWQHLIELSLKDGDKGDSFTYQVESKSRNGQIARHTITIVINSYLPYDLTVNTSSTLSFTVPNLVLDKFGSTDLIWKEQEATLTKVTTFSGNPLEYKQSGNQFELPPEFRDQKSDGSTIFLIKDA